MSGFEPWLPPLSPPPGGHARLVDALAGRRAHRHAQAWRVSLATACASLFVAVLVLALAQQRNPTRAQARQLAVEIEAAWKGADQDLAVSDGAALEVLRQPGLRVYWVDVDPAKASPSSSSPSPSR